MSASSNAAASDLWTFGPKDAPITVANADLVLAHLPIFLGGWPVRWSGDDDPAASEGPDVEIVRRADGTFHLVVTGPGGYDMAFEDEFNAANGLAGALVAVYVMRRPRIVCVHASAVEVAGGLAVMLGDSLSGKTSTALQMAAAGYRLFGDDRLALSVDVEPPLGTCLGLMPKVRLPLPDDSGARFIEYVEGFTEIRDDAAAYLKLWEGEAATFGEAAPVGALIVLDRQGGGEGVLEEASGAEVVRALLANCFAPHIEAARLVPQLAALAGSVPGYVARFSSSLEAARMIGRRLRERRTGMKDGRQ